MKWLRSQVQWDVTGSPWDHTTPECPLCPLHHGTIVHKHLIHCMHWKVAFCNTSGLWQDTVTEWWDRAVGADLHDVLCLRIAQPLWDHIPRALRVDLRARAVWQ